jgi:hypothetical protein
MSAALRALLFCLSFCLLVTAADSARAQNATRIEKKPVTAGSKRTTPISVVHGNLDALGTRLVFHLKDAVNTSSLFRLTDADEKKIQLLVTTKEEFPSRPTIGSIYSVIWIFSAGSDVLTHYLDNEVGVVTPETVNEVAEALAARTDVVASGYLYLFE